MKLKHTFSVLALTALLTACSGRAPAPERPAEVRTAPEATLPSEPPAPLPLEETNFPAYHERTLSNGARVLVVEDHEQPIASTSVFIRTGSAADPEDEVGVASFTANLLDNGTESRTAEEIAEAIDFVGGSLVAGTSDDWTTVTAVVPTTHLDTGLELLSDVVLNPTFPADELEVERTRELSNLQVQLSQPQSIAGRRFISEIYGEHPYGSVETPETVRAIQRADLERFHSTYYRPENALIVVSGDVDPDRVVRRIEQKFSGWERAEAPEVRLPEPPEQAQRRLVFVHKPGTVQAVFRLGHLMPPASNDDWVELDVMNRILGGGTTGWMFRVLRSEKGYTYGAYSSAVERQDPGYFQAAAEVRNEVADSAMAEMLAMLERLRTEPVPRQDLVTAKSYMAGSFPLSIETPQAVGRQLAQALLLGRSPEYVEQYRERIEDVSAADVQRVAREYLDPDRMVVVVVGDASQILDDLAPYADTVELYDVDGSPLTREDLEAPRASAVDFDASALQEGTLTYGVNVQGNPFGEAVNTIERTTEEGRSVIRAGSRLQAGPVSVRTETVFDAETFDPIRARIEGGQVEEAVFRMEEGRVTGHIDPPTGDPEQVDVEVPEGTLLPGMGEVAISLLDLQPGAEYHLPTVSAQGQPQTLSVEVVGESTVEVPSGTFEVYEVEATSGPQAFRYFVRKEAPHIMIRQEFAGQPIIVELKAME